MTAAPHVGKIDLPEFWRLADIARHLGCDASTLVDASRAGRFVPLVRVGRCWHARADLVRAWFDRQHAQPVDELRLAAVREVARQGAAPDRRRRAVMP